MNVNSFLKSIRENQSPTKAEETELLDTLHLTFLQHGNSYLSSLFTADMVHWVVSSMQQDTSCDLFAAVGTAGYQANQREAKTKTERDDAREEVAELKIAYSAQNADLQARNEKIASYLDKFDQMEDERLRLLSAIRTHDQFASAIENEAMSAWMDDRAVDPSTLKTLLNRLNDSLPTE